MIAYKISNKKRNETVTELFIRVKKPTFFTVFITQSYSQYQKMFD